MSDPSADRWLQPTGFLDCDHPDVVGFARDAVGDAADPTEQAVRLFYRVRDGWWYDPHGSGHERGEFVASHIAGLDTGWCVTKSILLTASARAVGIPSRL